MRSSLFRSGAIGVSLLLLSVSGCQCADDTGFDNLKDPPDAGPEEPPPPPPKFPLRAGDQVILPGVGGRTLSCGAAEGACDRVIRATYDINDVVLDEDLNRWTVDADFIYEMAVANTDAASIGQLFLSRAAPFADIEQGGFESGTAEFRTDGAPTDGMIPNDFPFFHFEAAYATQEGSAFQAASATLTERILELDPDAEIENQAAASKLEAYFKDELGATPMLHKIRVEYHPFGFMCLWDERLTTWEDGMARNEGSFAGKDIPLAAVFTDPVQIVRDDVRYRCSCFTKLCQNGNGDAATCLNPADPDAEPVPCNEL